MFCGECGTENPDTNRFCKNCGKPLKQTRPVPAPGAPVQAPPPAPQQGVPAAGITATPQPYQAAGQKPKKAKDFNEFKSSLMTVDEFKKMSKEVPLAKRPQKWWDLLSILGGITSAILWLLYSGIREGFDFLTPLLMIAIPVCMIWFREDLDVMLLPLKPRRKDVNKLLLVGIGWVMTGIALNSKPATVSMQSVTAA